MFCTGICRTFHLLYHFNLYIADLHLCKQTFMFYILKNEKIGEVGKTNKQTNYIFSQN